MTTASKITMVRIALIPVFLLAVLWQGASSWIWALLIFMAASATDGLDGHVARRYNQVSNFGKFLDPLADKLLVISALLVFVEWGQMPVWAVLLIVAREFAVTGLRLIAVEGGKVIAAGLSGKIKTAASIFAIALMLTPLHDQILFASVTVDAVCIAVMVLTTLWSGADYFIQNARLLKPER